MIYSRDVIGVRLYLLLGSSLDTVHLSYRCIVTVILILLYNILIPIQWIYRVVDRYISKSAVNNKQTVQNQTPKWFFSDIQYSESTRTSSTMKSQGTANMDMIA